MTLKAIKTVVPFDFRSDFCAVKSEDAPAERSISEDEDRVVLKTEEFAALLMTIRAEGVADAEARADAGRVEHLESAVTAMQQALGDLVALTSHIEATSRSSHEAERSAELIRSVAQRIIDGQGDLFAELKALTSSSENETRS